MSHTNPSTHEDHGSMQSYVVGFILSLVFSFIPYYMVVNQSVTGTRLLVVILSFAFIQMLIQIVFFLHIGRGPKPNWNLHFFIGTVGIVLMVTVGSVFIINNLHYNMSPTDKVAKIANDENIYQVGGQVTGACKQLGTNHQVTIKGGTVTPLYTVAAKCDTLTFINSDDARDIAFGAPSSQSVYVGETELLVKKGRSKTITLSQVGTFQYYDNKQPGTAGHFTVTE